MPVEDVDAVFSHVFEREHLMDGKIKRFDPEYYMVHSWIRLRDGKNIQEHDRMLLLHERAEEKIMGTRLDIPYEKAHDEVEKTYSYQKALTEYLKTHEA